MKTYSTRFPYAQKILRDKLNEVYKEGFENGYDAAIFYIEKYFLTKSDDKEIFNNVKKFWKKKSFEEMGATIEVIDEMIGEISKEIN